MVKNGDDILLMFDGKWRDASIMLSLLPILQDMVSSDPNKRPRAKKIASTLGGIFPAHTFKLMMNMAKGLNTYSVNA